tara:strand:+ start:26789 stop:28552 length:1764 start_codon:yes stop_codon:yes gene_type:complete
MIKVLINDYILDLASTGVTIVEKNNMFRNEQTKSFSYPFPLILTDEIAIALGISDIKNICNYPTKINVTVIENSTYYSGYLKISKIVNKTANITLFYGYETLAVYDMLLNTLPFQKVNVADVKAFAKTQNSKQWPDATHNFVTIKDTDYVNNNDYSYFEGYINNTLDGDFIENVFVTVDGNSVASNKNIMMPMPYLMEILKVGYAQENKVIKGSFVDDVFNHKIVYVPETHLEQFSTTQLDTFDFTTPTINYISGQIIYSSYKKQFVATFNGSYKLELKLDLPKEVASFFELKIDHGGTELFSLSSKDEEVHISETLTISVDDANSNLYVTFSLILKEQVKSIADYIFVKYEYQETKLNIFNNSYSLANFMPNITFRTFVNLIENIFNLDKNVQENVVYLNYIDDLLPTIIYDDHSKHETPIPIRFTDNEKVFALKFDDKQELFVNRNGIVPSTNASNLENVVSINMPIYPLKFSAAYGKATVVNTTENTTMKLCLYNGLVGLEPLAVEVLEGRNLQIKDIYKKWKTWLHFRTNSEIIEDSFFASVSENFNIKKGMTKYNKKHIIKEIQKKSINKNFNKITIKTETF